MNYKTHIIVGTTTALSISLLSKKFNYDLPIHGDSYILSAVLGSLLPDIEHPNSILGSAIPKDLHFIKHRTITHSLFFSIICLFICSIFININVGFGLFIGILSHIILDMLDKRSVGVSLLAPISYEKIGLYMYKNK